MEKRTPRQLRGDRYTVEEMADYLQIHKSNYSRKERGLTRFTIGEAVKLAELYNVPVEAISFEHCVAERSTEEADMPPV